MSAITPGVTPGVQGRDPMPTILIVDDTPPNLGVVVDNLESYGFRVIIAEDGTEALKRAQFVHPDLILMDVMMPGIDGFETCRRLKADERTRDIPVIFMTALTETDHVVKGFEAGGVDYVTKPFQVVELLARIKTHLSLRSAQQNLLHAYDDLEVRITQRTAELAESNAQLKVEIGDRERAEIRIRYLAQHDVLTDLPNHLLFRERVNLAIADAEGKRQFTAVLLIDLDRFKNINDALGHEAGDQLLRAVAQRLQYCMGDAGNVARLGGDEFVINLPGLADGKAILLVCTKVLEDLHQPFRVGNHELHVSGSIGISVFPTDGDNADALLRAADAAMYHAKEMGRDNYQFFTASMHKDTQRRLSIANKLHQGLQRSEFLLHYQPQLDLESGRIFGAEALVRWRQPDGSLIPPNEFIRIAEETGFIVRLGEWVLREACEQAARWRAADHADLRIAVNLSPRQFQRPGFPALVARILQETGLPPAALELEITEGVLTMESPENMATLEQLAAMGIELAIDDFGTGYSSLSYLQRFPIHALKIDQSFVAGIAQDANDTAIVTAIIAMAHSLRLKVVAEGVETVEQARFLKSRGCLAAQGYYFGKPVPSETFIDMLRSAVELRALLPVPKSTSAK